MEVDCPRCQAVVQMENPDQPAYCRNCGASLALELGDGGFALVSAEDMAEEDAPPPPGEPEEPTIFNDPILEDHHRWRVGAVFSMLLGLAALGCVLYSGFKDFSILGSAAFTQGKEALYFWIIAAAGLAMIALGGLVFRISNAETSKYLAAWEKRRSHA